jgi:cytochrome c-type biogenesis protein CcmH
MSVADRTIMVVPAKAGTHFSAARALDRWIPAFAGMTEQRSRQAQRIFFGLVLLLAIVAGLSPAQAVRPDEMLSDPGLEARARAVGSELRCLVCRNQSIDDSDADLAHDLRVLVRERIAAGDSNDRVIAYVRARYGDFVLLRPPFEIGTLLLWGGPVLILIFGGVALARFYRRPGQAPTAPLSPEERRRLAAVLGQGTER